MAGVLEWLGDGFGFRHQLAVGIVGIGVGGLLGRVGQGHRVAGAVVVVDVEGVAGGVDHGGKAVAVDVISCDDVAGVGFGQQVAGGVVDVFGNGSVSCGFDAVADAVIDVAAAALGGQPMGVVVAVSGGALGLELAFVVVAVDRVAAGQPVLLRVVAVSLAGVDSFSGSLGSVTTAWVKQGASLATDAPDGSILSAYLIALSTDSGY